MNETHHYAKCPDCKGKKNGCRYCDYTGRKLIANEYGVFKWTNENRYPRAAAIAVFKSERAADLYIDRHSGNNYVSRGIID